MLHADGGGTQLGAYRVLQQIGEGGMGSVWLAEHAMLGRRAALKVLHPMFSAQPEIVTRFFNEARAATAIADPGIVQIFDFGLHTDGSAYIVMELLDGETLDKRLARLSVVDLDAADDPWGHAMRITCIDQPSDQIVGVISAGPDGTFGTKDDIASWNLRRDVTEAVRGPRWKSNPKIASKTSDTKHPTVPITTPPDPTPPAPTPPPVPTPTPTPPPAPKPPDETPTEPHGDPSLPETIDKNGIARVMAKVRPRVIACGAGFPGTKLRVSVVVAPDGAVSSVVVKDSPDGWLSDCVSQRIKVATFPRTRSGGTFGQSFKFGGD